MYTLENEAEKIIAYTMGRGSVEASDIAAVCCSKNEDHIFDLINAVAEKKKDLSMALYAGLLAMPDEKPNKLLYLLMRNFTQMYKAKRCVQIGADSAQAGAVIGGSPWQVKKILAASKQFSTEALVAILKAGSQTDMRIKTGMVNDKVGVESFIVECLI
jgi:DNA polymerase-3 subunit delta